MMKLYPHQNLTAHKRTYSLLGILANRYGIYFTIINLELKINENVLLTMLILHNIMIRSLHSLNAYWSASLMDHADENGNLSEREQQKNITGDISYPC